MDDNLHQEMIRDDFKFATAAFDTGDFQLMNIAGNRLMSDAILGPNVRAAIIGFFIKDLAINYMNLKSQLSDSDFAKAKSFGQRYLVSAAVNLTSIDWQSLVWTDFHVCDSQLTKYQPSAVEAGVYRENLSVTAYASHYFVDYLIENKDLLCDSHNNLLDAILSELQRISRVFGAAVSDTATFALLVALQRYYEYLRSICTVRDGQLDSEKLAPQINPFIDRLAAITRAPELSYQGVNTLLWDLIRRWREFFWSYAESRRKTPSLDKVIELPEESKKKLSEVVGKALQKELKP